MTSTEWLRIESAAREQVTAELTAAETTPLEPGQLIAWVGCKLGRTDSLGPVHRVGTWRVDYATTTCGEVIPPPKRRLPLSVALVRSLGYCKWCEAQYAKEQRLANQTNHANHGVAA